MPDDAARRRRVRAARGAAGGIGDGIGAADERTYARHGYDTALRTQIDHGIFGYCGATVAASRILYGIDSASAASHITTARELGRNAFAHQGTGVVNA